MAGSTRESELVDDPTAVLVRFGMDSGHPALQSIREFQ